MNGTHNVAHSYRYFLADNTISIEEPRITNSGLTQGKFMRRLQVARPLNSRLRDSIHSKDENKRESFPLFEKVVQPTTNGSGSKDGGVFKGVNGCKRSSRDIYTPADFGVGEEIWIHGRRFRIVDADLNTRQWYERCLGRSLKSAEDYPEDGYRAQRAKVSVPSKRYECACASFGV